ncbi:uncharacterized protein STEHIDRAFT_109023 [Stereum hirsutum FP-91666 SS1]|uniref:uncharacterized protein n=1 Tax=Stereum hirsutum (strain FP-91666) TaxID=721885 RepID=UPI000440E491|nr:uncharacterized protein STEHIDRAFT_109023 [Stereum hirsutum FP-91666 SS1]EIM88647.1 hypothetical protein STEHIDRAFT_109023 [Stereum hirsutum FP-91666 SS1]
MTCKCPVTRPEWVDFLPTSHLRNTSPTSYGCYPLLSPPPLAAPTILSYLSLAPKSVNKADTFKNSPLAPSGIWEMLREEAEALSAEDEKDGEVKGGDAEREGKRVEDGTVDSRGKAKECEEGENEKQVAEGTDTTAATEKVRPVQEPRDLDFHHLQLSFEWESEWKRALSLAKRVPQPGSGIGMGPLGAMPAGGFGLGRMGPGGPAGAMGGLGGGFGRIGGLGAGAGTANPRVQEKETVRPTEVFQLGSLEGVWEGLFTYTEYTVYAVLLSGAPPPTLLRALVARHQQTWKLREYHLLSPEVPNGNSGTTTTTTNNNNNTNNTNTNTQNVPDQYCPLSMGDPLTAYLPMGVDISVVGGGQERLEVREPGRRETLVYYRCPLPSVPSTDAPTAPSTSNPLAASMTTTTTTTTTQDKLEPVTQPTYQRHVHEVLLTGEGHSAWGQFNLVGRVRPYDGLVSLSKVYLDGDRGK